MYSSPTVHAKCTVVTHYNNFQCDADLNTSTDGASAAASVNGSVRRTLNTSASSDSAISSVSTAVSDVTDAGVRTFSGTYTCTAFDVV